MAPKSKRGPECPKCGCRDVRTRRTDGITWCRKCGFEWKNEDNEENT